MNPTPGSPEYSAGYRNTTIAAMARDKALHSPLDTAIYLDSGEPITYASIYGEALALAAALAELGCGAGDVLSFQLPNWREAVAVDIAACLLGMAINPVIPIYRDRELAFILKDAAAKVIVIPETFRGFDFVAMIKRLKPDLPNLQHLVVVGGASERSDGFTPYQQLIAEGMDSAFIPAEVSPDALKIILYTSGTTGNPKAVRHSHNTLTRALDNGADAWGLGAADLMLMPSPVTHITGFVNGIELPFFTGTRTILMEQWEVSRAIDLIQRLKATTCLSATPFLQELVQECRTRGERLSTLRFFACGGASVPPGLIYDTHRVLERCRSFRVYGSTEVPLVTVGFMKPEQERLAAETDGCIFNWEVRVSDDDGNPLPNDQDGEILVRGPAMMLGYGDDHQNADALTADGYFRTGDIGHITADNAIVITDRKKDIIIRGGENISAREVEDVLHGHGSVQQVAAVAMPHARLGEGVCAFMVIKNGEQMSLDEMKEFLATTGLAKQKWPERLEIRESLPMTASGKIKKDVLRAELKEKLAPAQ